VLAAISDQYIPANWHAFYKRQGVALINSAAILFEARMLMNSSDPPHSENIFRP
jgi:hypothetical protein